MCDPLVVYHSIASVDPDSAGAVLHCPMGIRTAAGGFGGTISIDIRESRDTITSDHGVNTLNLCTSHLLTGGSPLSTMSLPVIHLRYPKV